MVNYPKKGKCGMILTIIVEPFDCCSINVIKTDGTKLSVWPLLMSASINGDKLIDLQTKSKIMKIFLSDLDLCQRVIYACHASVPIKLKSNVRFFVRFANSAIV